MRPFLSYNWSPTQLAGDDLLRAFNTLTSGRATDEQLVAAFGVLLASESVAAKGIAFDHFSYAETEAGGYNRDNPYLIFRPQLLHEARAQLQSPPINTQAPDGSIVEGANHASALHVLWRIGEPADLALIAPILSASQDETVLWIACRAAGSILSDMPDCEPVTMRALTALIFAPAYPDAVRCEAVAALDNCETPEAEATLFEAAKKCPYPVSGYAARALYFRAPQKYLTFLRQLIDTWPHDAHYPAFDLRRRIMDDEQNKSQDETLD